MNAARLTPSLVFIAFALGVQGLSSVSAADDSGPDAEATSPIPTATRARTADGRAIQVTLTTPNLTIDAVYPRLPGDTEAVDAANRLIEQTVNDITDDFRSSYQALLAGNDGEHLGPPWVLKLDSGQVYAATAFWTIPLELYEYTGGAHGGSHHRPLVIRRSNGSEIAPADLFRPDSPWLIRLSSYCRQALAEREAFSADDDWLRTGTAPEAENYRVLLPLAGGLTVVFGQYQIGPYAIGISEVAVPYATLAPLLNPALFGPAATEAS